VEINTVKPGQVIEFQPYLHACRYPVGHRLLTLTLSYSSSVFTSLAATTFVRSLKKNPLVPKIMFLVLLNRSYFFNQNLIEKYLICKTSNKSTSYQDIFGELYNYTYVDTFFYKFKFYLKQR